MLNPSASLTQETNRPLHDDGKSHGIESEAATRLAFCILCRVSKRWRREEGASPREGRN